MAISVTCTKVVQQNGSTYFFFGKHGIEFASVAQAQAHVERALPPEVLEAIIIAKTLNAGSAAAAVGRTATGDLTITNVVRVQ